MHKIYSNGAGKLCNATTHPTGSVGSSVQPTESVNMEARKRGFLCLPCVFLIDAEFP